MRFPIYMQMLGERLSDALPRGASVHLDGHGLVRVDADVATAFVAQELEHLRSQTYDVRKVARKIRTFLNVSNEAHPGAEVIAYDSFDDTGEAAIVEQYGKDFPRVNTVKDRKRDTVFSLGISYGFTVQDLRAAAMAGTPLDTRRAMQARRGMEARMEKIGARGVAAKGKAGLINNSDVTVFGTALSWDMTTPALTIMRELHALSRAVNIASRETWQPNTMVLPPDAFAIASTVTFGSDSPRSALAAFLEVDPYIERVDQWQELDGAGASPGQDRILCYNDSPDVAELQNPVEYEEMPPEVRGMEFVVHGHMRTGGAVVRYPLAMLYADGTFNAADITA